MDKDSPSPEQKKCEDDVGHDIEWHAPDWEVGYPGGGRCKLCGLIVPYEAMDLEDDYGC